MAKSASPNKMDFTARLASARQSLSLLKSQIQSDDIENEYWVTRLEDLAVLLAELSEERQASRQQRRLATLYQVSSALGSSLDLDQVLNQAMDSIIELTEAERGFVMMFGDEGELEVRVARNMEQETLNEDKFAISRSVIQMVADTGEPVVTTNATKDPRFSGQTSVVVHNLRSIQCVSLHARGESLGVIYVDNRVKAGVFDEDDLDTLTAFGSQVGMAIENARLFTLTDEALARRVEELQRLQEIDQQLNETLDFTRVMGLTLEWAMRVTQADNGVIALIDLESGETDVIAQVGDTPTGVTGMLSGEAVNRPGSLTVPVQREGRVIGVIALDRQDNQSFDFEAQAFVNRMADHAAISIENAQLYDAVKKANDAKSEFVSVMTHELRVPMTSIKGYAEMMTMVGALNEKQQEFLEIIRSNVARMSVQVSDLSDIARIESGRLNVEIENDVDFGEVLEDVVLALQGEINNREHTMTVDVPDELPSVSVDPQRLNQILINLISNAYKYTPNGGQLTIRAKHNDAVVQCEISDSGVGMTEEELSLLYLKFWRSDDRYVREQPGTGLGVTIAKSLVEIQGGALTVESKKGEGTTFTFTVPVSE